MTKRLYILTWFWVAAGKSLRYFMLADSKENYEYKYKRSLKMTKTDIN